MRVAVYRCFYGEDFLRASISSIRRHFDKIYLFWTDRPWKSVSRVRFLGEDHRIPWRKGHAFDRSVEIATELRLHNSSGGGEVITRYFHQDDPMGQFANMVNRDIVPKYKDLEFVACLEPDFVFQSSQIAQAIEEFDREGYEWATTKQVEIWKQPGWCILPRGRVSAVFWRASGGEMPATRRNPSPANGRLSVLEAHVHNMGFAVGFSTMFWKHMTAIGFSKAIGDTPPNPLWLKKWQEWSPTNQLRNLEIAAGHEHLIPKATSYNGIMPEELTEWISEKAT